MGSNAHDEERERLAFVAMRAYRRVMTPRLSEESVQHLWATQERERVAWRAVVEAVLACHQTGCHDDTASSP